jgi:THAP domain
VGCSNRSEKGFRVFRFPRDSERRSVWEVKVRREGWTPTDSSYLCEVSLCIYICYRHQRYSIVVCVGLELR